MACGEARIPSAVSIFVRGTCVFEIGRENGSIGSDEFCVFVAELCRMNFELLLVLNLFIIHFLGRLFVWF